MNRLVFALLFIPLVRENYTAFNLDYQIQCPDATKKWDYRMTYWEKDNFSKEDPIGSANGIVSVGVQIAGNLVGIQEYDEMFSHGFEIATCLCTRGCLDQDIEMCEEFAHGACSLTMELCSRQTYYLIGGGNPNNYEVANIDNS